MNSGGSNRRFWELLYFVRLTTEKAESFRLRFRHQTRQNLVSVQNQEIKHQYVIELNLRRISRLRACMFLSYENYYSLNQDRVFQKLEKKIDLE